MNFEIEIKQERKAVKKLEKEQRTIESELIVRKARIKRLETTLAHQNKMKSRIAAAYA